jgi:hypothetical protein
MMGEAFGSCWLKIRRAEEHLSTLRSELAAWLDRQAYSVSKKYDAKSGRHSLIVKIDGAAPFDRLSLIAGDCAHNLRCALDHLVYALAIRNTAKNPPKHSATIQFPIVDSPEAFQKQRYRIESLSDTAQDFIETKQPYNQPHSVLPPILAVLNNFDNVDKHRLIHFTYSHNAGGKISFLPPLPQPAPKIQWVNEPLESGDEFVYFMSAPAQPEVKYKYEAEFCIAVRHIAGPTGRTTSPLESVIVGMIAEVKRIARALI